MTTDQMDEQAEQLGFFLGMGVMILLGAVVFVLLLGLLVWASRKCVRQNLRLGGWHRRMVTDTVQRTEEVAPRGAKMGMAGVGPERSWR